MSRSFVTNMMQFIDSDGSLLKSTPVRALRFTQRMLKIVAHVTEKPSEEPRPALLCWNKINRKCCPGKIDAGIDFRKLNILWHCLACGDHGLIYHWENTPWDGKHR